uniref:Uncharacterized protein n=1 Tax=Panagrolaimus sp. ES5 TaxID=591445 RepID=A0AC34G127_9BILA
MSTEKEWSSEFRSDITRAFKNCAHEGRIIAEEHKNMAKNYTDLKGQHQNSVQRFTADKKAMEKELEEKNQRIAKIKEDTVAAENTLKIFKAQLQKCKENIQELKKQNEIEKQKAVEKIEKESTKKFEIWKNEFQIKMESKLNKQKQFFKLITDTTISNEPSWLISHNFCNSIYKSHQKDANCFAYSFVKELFTLGEIILPKRKLDLKKIKEAAAVLSFYFFKSVNNEKLLDDALNKRRSEVRQNFYQKVNKNGIIGINAAGDFYFYKSDVFGRFIPYKDAEFTEAMNASMNACLFQKSYGIPDIYQKCGFITVIHISPSDGICHHYLHASTGYLEENIHSVYKIEKKEKL